MSPISELADYDEPNAAAFNCFAWLTGDKGLSMKNNKNTGKEEGQKEKAKGRRQKGEGIRRRH